MKNNIQGPGIQRDCCLRVHHGSFDVVTSRPDICYCAEIMISSLEVYMYFMYPDIPFRFLRHNEDALG